MLKYTWNAGAASAHAGEPVGEVSVRFLPDDPTRAVVSWQWNQQSNTVHNECLQDFSRDNNRAASANAAFSGPWFEPGWPGYGYQVAIAPVQAGYSEIASMTLYDTAGEPVWLQAQRTGLAAPPPTGANLNPPMDLKYYISPYAGGYPVGSCGAGCSPIERSAGTLDRTFINAASATATLNASYTGSTGTVNQTVSWRRPASGVGTVAMAKLAAVSQVLVDRTGCVAGACPVRVDFAADPSDPYAPQARVYRRQLEPVSSTLYRLPVNTSTGEYTDQLGSAGTFRYELKQFDNPLAPDLAFSADVTVSAAPPSTCSLDDWTTTVGSPVAAAPSIAIPGVRYAGDCGMQVLAVGSYVTDARPQAESNYNARFFYYTGDRIGGSADIFQALAAGGGTPLIRVQHDGNVLTYSAKGSGTTRTVTVQDNKWYAIELQWKSGAGTGSLGLRVTGAASDSPLSTPTITGLNNPTDRVEDVRLGLISGFGTGAVGFDEFQARRITQPKRLCRGDANNDGMRTIADATVIVHEFTSGVLAAGQPDCNEDGIVTTGDAVCVSALFVNNGPVCP